MILQRIQQFSQYTMKKLPYHRSQGATYVNSNFFGTNTDQNHWRG